MKRILLSAAMIAALSASAQSKNVRPQFVNTSGTSLDTELVQNTDTRLYRTLYQGYNTVCMPYTVAADDFVKFFGEGARLEKPVGALTENGDFVLCFADCTGEDMEAGMPYLVYSEKFRSAKLTNTTGNVVTTPAKVSFTDGQGNVATFRGSFERLEPVGTWAIPAVQGEVPANLICCDGARILNPTRCFFTWDNQQNAQNMVIRHVAASDIVTGLNAVGITTAEGTTYNLAGQRLEQAHGITIKGGKKVIK